MQDLRSEHDQLKLNHKSFKDEATSRFSRYDANHKLTSDMFKRVESDFTEFQNVQSKTNDDIKRLAKVSSTCQKQISTIQPNKTYANAASEQTKASPTSPDRNVPKKIQINVAMPQKRPHSKLLMRLSPKKFTAFESTIQIDKILAWRTHHLF